MLTAVHVAAGLWRHSGGAGVAAPKLCSALVRAGCHVVLVALDGPLSDDTKQCAEAGVKLRTYPPLWRHSIWYSPALSRGVRDAAQFADLIHVRSLWLHPSWAGAAWARRLGKPLVISPRGTLMPGALRRSRLRKAAAWFFRDRHSLGHAACLHACTVAELQAIRALGIQCPVAVIPNGVDIPDLPPAGPFLERHPELVGRRLALFLARVHPAKGVLDLIDAWARLATKQTEWHLVIAGPVETGFGPKLHRRVRAHSLVDRVSLVGPVYGMEKLAAYSAASLYVLPTYSENYGIGVAEALSAGLPVVTTHGAPWPEIEEVGCGWRSPVGPEHLTSDLASAMRTGQVELREMGGRGRDFVAAKHGWDEIGRQTCALYKWLLGGGPPPAGVQIDLGRSGSRKAGIPWLPKLSTAQPQDGARRRSD